MSKFYEDDGGTCTAAGISGSGKSGTVCADSFKDFVPQNCLTVACADKEKKLEGVKMANRIAESAMADVDIYEQDFEQGIKDALDETSVRDLCVNNEDILAELIEEEIPGAQLYTDSNSGALTISKNVKNMGYVDSDILKEKFPDADFEAENPNETAISNYANELNDRYNVNVYGRSGGHWGITLDGSAGEYFEPNSDGCKQYVLSNPVGDNGEEAGHDLIDLGQDEDSLKSCLKLKDDIIQNCQGFISDIDSTNDSWQNNADTMSDYIY